MLIDTKNIKLAIICPMANEKDTAVSFINDVISKCKKYLFASICFFSILDNASKDGTISILTEHSANVPELKVVYAPENKNVVDAYKRGYTEALASGADWILEIDAGYSHNPNDIPKFFALMKNGYDCVYGSRFCKGGQIINSPKKRYLISKGGTILANLFLGTRLTDMTSGFQLFSNSALKSILNKGITSNGPFFQTEMKFNSRKLNIAEAPITYSNAGHNIGKIEMKDAFGNLFKLSLSRFRK